MRKSGGNCLQLLVARDFQSLSLFRIVFSIYLSVDFLVHDCQSFNELYGPNGILPSEVISNDTSIPAIIIFGPLFQFIDHLQPQIWFSPLYLISIICFGRRIPHAFGQRLLACPKLLSVWQKSVCKNGRRNSNPPNPSMVSVSANEPLVGGRRRT